MCVSFLLCGLSGVRAIGLVRPLVKLIFWIAILVLATSFFVAFSQTRKLVYTSIFPFGKGGSYHFTVNYLKNCRLEG